MKLKLIALILFTAISTFALEGKVVSIADGDTITILTADNQQVNVSFLGIDTPEMAQAFGTAEDLQTGLLLTMGQALYMIK